MAEKTWKESGLLDRAELAKPRGVSGMFHVTDLVFDKGTSKVTLLIVDPCYLNGHQETNVLGQPFQYPRVTIRSFLNRNDWKYLEIWVEIDGGRVLTLQVTGTGKDLKDPKHVGDSGVDSGQMMVIPTFMVPAWKEGDFNFGADSDFLNPPNDYFQSCLLTLTSCLSGGYLPTLNAYVTSSGWGDGVYPVYTDAEGTGLLVDFSGNKEEEDEES